MFYRPGKRFCSLHGFELVIMYSIFSCVFGLPYRLASLLINVFHIFPSPNPYFGASWEETGTNQHYFPFFSYTLFPFIPIQKSKFRGILVKNGIGAPSSSFRIHFSHLLIQILKRFGKRWSWTPTEPAAYPFVTACMFGHSIRQ